MTVSAIRFSFILWTSTLRDAVTNEMSSHLKAMSAVFALIAHEISTNLQVTWSHDGAGGGKVLFLERWPASMFENILLKFND